MPVVPPERPSCSTCGIDLFERAGVTSDTYDDWSPENGIVVRTAIALVGQFLGTFKKFPTQQKAPSASSARPIERLEQQPREHMRSELSG